MRNFFHNKNYVFLHNDYFSHDKKCFSAQLASSFSCPPDFLLICTAARCRTCNCDRRRVGQLASSGGGSTGGSTLRIVATWMCAKKCVVFCEPAVICQRWFIYRILEVTLVFHLIFAPTLVLSFTLGVNDQTKLVKRVKDTFSKRHFASWNFNRPWCSLIE